MTVSNKHSYRLDSLRPIVTKVFCGRIWEPVSQGLKAVETLPVSAGAVGSKMRSISPPPLGEAHLFDHRHGPRSHRFLGIIIADISPAEQHRHHHRSRPRSRRCVVSTTSLAFSGGSGRSINAS